MNEVAQAEVIQFCRLRDLIPVFIDVETYITKSITLKKMTLRQYLAKSHLTTLAVGVGADPTLAFYTERSPGPPGCRFVNDALVALLRKLAVDPRYVFIAHNAAFDMRVLTTYLGVPHPINVWCTLEGSMGAWPELPGGYRLANIAARLILPVNKRKLSLNLELMTKFARQAVKRPVPASKVPSPFLTQLKGVIQAGELRWDGVHLTKEIFAEILGVYNIRDVDAMREIYLRQVDRISEAEQLIGLRTHHQRRWQLSVDQTRLHELLEKLDVAILDAEDRAAEYLDDGQVEDIFNRETSDRRLKSIRTHRLKRIVNASLANEEFTSVSYKKVSPIMMARNPNAAAVITQAGRANKAMSHARKVSTFEGTESVDVELGAWRSHTARFSSPSVGRGLNLHNCVSAYSLILTRRGWVPILALNTEDLLWDGIKFVAFHGVTYEGRRSTMKVGAAELTPEQPVLSSGQQKMAAADLSPWQLVQCVAVGLSASLRGLLALPSPLPAMDAERRLRESSCTLTSLSAVVGAPTADLRVPGQRASRPIATTPSSAAATSGCSTASGGPPTRTTLSSLPPSLPPEAAESVQPGSRAPRRISRTYRRYLGGMISRLQLIESTTCADTSPETCVSLLRQLTDATNAILSSSQVARGSLNTVRGSALNTSKATTFTARDVFDIRGAGPRERFVANGIVTFNCPKHDKMVAEPIRKTFRLPDTHVFVRGDLANVELRVEGKLTGSKAVATMFDPLLGGALFTDPYSAGWKNMTGVIIANKKDPVRQVSKASHLGLGFCMSPTGFARVLLNTISDPKSGVKSKNLKDMIVNLNWQIPRGDAIQRIMADLGCDQIVALAAYHVHRVFNETYPEFGATAAWIVTLVHQLAGVSPGRLGFEEAKPIIERAYLDQWAPDRDMINIQPLLDLEFGDRVGVTVGCGPWPTTVCWRGLKSVHDFGSRGDGRATVIIEKASGLRKVFTKPLAIENVTQAAARNALCLGVGKLDTLGYRDCLHIHDEVLLIVPKNRQAVLAARDALIKVFGPGHDMPMGWAILIKPSEVTVTQSLYEDEMDVEPIDKGGNDRWGKIERNEADMFTNLP